MINKRKIGSFGEKIAENFLKKKKYKIIQKNFQNKFGEIDLIARDQKQLVFAEVKFKSNLKFGLPEDEFNFYKKKKLARAIKGYFLEKKITTDNWRVDLIAIEGTEGDEEENLEIRHHQGATLT